MLYNIFSVLKTSIIRPNVKGEAMSYEKRNLPSADVNYNVTEYEEPKEEREEEKASPLTEEYYDYLDVKVNERKI